MFKNMMVAAKNVTKDQVEQIIAQVICARTYQYMTGNMESQTVYYGYVDLKQDVMAVTKNLHTGRYTVRLSKDFYSRNK